MIEFKFSNEEQVEYDRWLEEHNKVCRCFNPNKEDLERREKMGLGSWYPFGVGMTGRPLIYHITSDSLGWSCVVECSCGEKKDLSEFVNW